MTDDRSDPARAVSAERIVHVIPRREGQEIRATLSWFRGRLYASVRLYIRGEDGAWHATRKGLTLGADELHEMETALGALREAVDDEPKGDRRPDRYERYNRARAG